MEIRVLVSVTHQIFVYIVQNEIKRKFPKTYENEVQIRVNIKILVNQETCLTVIGQF